MNSNNALLTVGKFNTYLLIPTFKDISDYFSKYQICDFFTIFFGGPNKWIFENFFNDQQFLRTAENKCSSLW